jgi:tetratricopeptide (TPR) repeat protein
MTAGLHRASWPTGLWTGAVIVILAASVILILARKAGPTPPPPPAIDTAGFDPAIAAAIGEARQGVLNSPRSHEAWGRLGMVLLAHEMPAAAACFLTARDLAETDPRWSYYLAVSQLSGDLESAVANLERTLSLLPAQPRLQQHAGFAPRLRLAEGLLQLGRLDEAEGHFLHIREQQPDSAVVALGLGKLSHARGRHSEAVGFLAAARDDPATRKAARRLLVSSFQRLNRTNEIDRLTQAIERLPADEAFPDPLMAEVERLKTGLNAWTDRADQWLKAGRPRDAARLMETAVERYPNSERALFFLGRARHRMGDLAGAEASLRRAIALAPGMIEAHMQLGIIHLARRRTDEAGQCFRAAIRAKPNLAEAWYNLGLSLGGDRAESLTAFREAIRLRPGLIEAYLGLAVVLRAGGEFTEAREVVTRALQFCPDGPLRQSLLEQQQALARQSANAAAGQNSAGLSQPPAPQP